jgi:hypothetical protein
MDKAGMSGLQKQMGEDGGQLLNVLKYGNTK